MIVKSNAKFVNQNRIDQEQYQEDSLENKSFHKA
jgi:hypothetical protein